MLVLLKQESQRKSEGASEDQRKSLIIYESQIKINETQRIIDASERALTRIIGLRHENARSNKEVHSSEAKLWKITWNRRWHGDVERHNPFKMTFRFDYKAILELSLIHI